MSASRTRKIRSLKFVTQRKSAVGIERHSEAVHLPEEAAVELEPELLAAVPDQRRVDEQRAR